MNLKINVLLKKISFFFFSFVLLGLFGCMPTSDCPDISSSDELSEEDLIELYHSQFFSSDIVAKKTGKIDVYIDFSDGITKYCLSNKNNKKVYKKFFTSISTQNEIIDYFELSDDSVIPYTNSDIINYFGGKGFKHNGEFKTGAPLDKAINSIVENDNIGVLITDGELYNKESAQVSKEMWASKAFAKWFKKRNKLEIIYTDFVERNDGNDYKKHMYIMFFIPNNSDNIILNSYIYDLKDANLNYKTLSFSTNISNLYEREYKNAQTPGASKYLEYFTETEAYYASSNNAMELIDFTIAPFNLDDDGLIYYLRDAGDENGNKMNHPLLDKLFFHFDTLKNYDVEKIKIVVHNVFEDFNRFRRNYLARENPPRVLKNSVGKDSLTVENYLVFDCLTTIDGENTYDIDNKTQRDTLNSFATILSKDFEYNRQSFDYTEAGVLDFLHLDQTAGEVNEVNDAGKYEIVIKFHEQLNEQTNGLNNENPNLFRVDIILDAASIETIDKEALTWDKIDDSGLDEALYTSLKNTMKENKPSGVLYSYYLKFGPFNQ